MIRTCIFILALAYLLTSKRHKLIWMGQYIQQGCNVVLKTASEGGNWDDPATWGGSSPPITIKSGDTVTIPLPFTVSIGSGDTVTNNGTINNGGIILIVNNGTLTNSGTITNAGTIINTGSISGPVLGNQPVSACVVPSVGNWTISSSCALPSSATAPANVIVQSGVVLTIPTGVTLTIHLTTNHLLVKSGGGVFTKPMNVGIFTRFSTCATDSGHDCIGGFLGSQIRVNYFPSMAVDPSGSIHIVYDTNNTQTYGDISYVMSNDCNNSTSKAKCIFSNPVKINLDTTPTDQFEPELEISTKTVPPTIHVTANDRRDDNPGNVFWKPWDYNCPLVNSTYCTKPANWDNVKLNEEGSTNTDSNIFVGDYHGVFSSILREVYSVWTDTRSAIQHTFNYDIYGDRSRT